LLAVFAHVPKSRSFYWRHSRFSVMTHRGRSRDARRAAFISTDAYRILTPLGFDVEVDQF
jgi:hypothetical protein